jgi:hypothetical protein
MIRAKRHWLMVPANIALASSIVLPTTTSPEALVTSSESTVAMSMSTVTAMVTSSATWRESTVTSTSEPWIETRVESRVEATDRSSSSPAAEIVSLLRRHRFSFWMTSAKVFSLAG